MTKLFCCGNSPTLLNGNWGYWYKCETCGSSIGCHKGTTKPLGTILADRELKDLRMEAHEMFDYVWKQGFEKRNFLYRELAILMDIDIEECHFAMMSKPRIRNAIEIMKSNKIFKKGNKND